MNEKGRVEVKLDVCFTTSHAVQLKLSAIIIWCVSQLCQVRADHSVGFGPLD